MKRAKDIYLFIGPPGSGKGSLSYQCVQELGWKQLSTGNLCRKHVTEQTEIGKKIDFAIKSGKLISGELVMSMVAEWLKENAHNARAVILDGFPRTVFQAQSLDKLLDTQPKEWNLQVIKLTVPDDIVINRLCRRYICQNKECQAIYSLDTVTNNNETCTICAGPIGRRKDDEPVSIRERLIIYHKYEDELLDFYHKRGGAIKELKVEKPLPEVFRDFKQLIGFSSP